MARSFFSGIVPNVLVDCLGNTNWHHSSAFKLRPVARGTFAGELFALSHVLDIFISFKVSIGFIIRKGPREICIQTLTVCSIRQLETK